LKRKSIKSMTKIRNALKKNIFGYFFRKYVVIPCKILKTSMLDTIKQDGIEHAGYLAFLSIFSLFPFLIFLIALIGLLGADSAGQKIIYTALNSLPQDAASALLPRVGEIVSGPPQSFLTIAILGVIWTASSSVEGYRTTLNRAYRVHLPPPYLLRRLISIAEFFVITFTITAVIMIFVIIPSILKGTNAEIIVQIYIEHSSNLFNKFIIFIFLICSVSLLYYFIPNVKQKINKTFPGSIVTVILWTLTQKAFLYYINKFQQFSFIYGSLAGIMIYLMFFYLVNLIFIYGAQFNYHFYRVYKVFLQKK